MLYPDNEKRRSGSGTTLWKFVCGIGDLFGRFGLLQTDDAIAFLPFAALLEQLDALEALKDVTLYPSAAGRFIARML